MKLPPPISPQPVSPDAGVVELVERYFSAYNAARLREAAMLWAEKIAREDVVVGLGLSGALTPAGLGTSCLVPLVRAGLVDFIASTGANLYHDLHYALGMGLHPFTPHAPDPELKAQGLVRIYDIVMDYRVLLDTDAFVREALKDLSGPMPSPAVHHALGKALAERGSELAHDSLLVACYEMGVPIYAPSPGDSSIGMNIAALALTGQGPAWDVNADVSEAAALLHQARNQGQKSAVVIIGGGAPKNFLLQTGPYLQEVLGLEDHGYDYFIQITDARPDTGGLSGATPSEAVSWGKVDPGALPDTVVCYLDATVALPILTSYLLAKAPKRRPKRLYETRAQALEVLKAAL